MRAILLRIALAIFPDRDFVSLLKWETKLFLIFLYSRISPWERSKTAAWKRKSGLKVNLGGGAGWRRPGWISVDSRIRWERDGLVGDLRRALPLTDGSVRSLFTEHVLEHLSYPEPAHRLLRECFRVLEPGGRLRLIVPDAELYLRAYCENRRDFLAQVGEGQELKLAVVNRVFREKGFHKYAYDFEMLKTALEACGFGEVRRSGFHESRDPELNLDLDQATRKLLSLYVEAVRPLGPEEIGK